MSKLKLTLSLAALATLAACGGRHYHTTAAATPAPTAYVATAPAAVVVVETTPMLRPGFGRVTAISPLYYNNGTASDMRRLTLTMNDGSMQVLDSRGPNIAVGEPVEITPERYIRYPVSMR